MVSTFFFTCASSALSERGEAKARLCLTRKSIAQTRDKTSPIVLFFFCGPLTAPLPSKWTAPFFRHHSARFRVTTVLSMYTLSTGYQRPQPRIITRSRPFHRLTATTRPQEYLTCVVPWKACSTSAALIWRTLVECIGHSFRSRDALFSRSPQWEAWERLSRRQ